DYLWHYDGKRWIPWYATYHGEKGLAYCTGEALFGFSANNVWMGGQSLGDPGAGLCHWDGTRWGRYFNYNPQPDTFGLVSIRQIWGRRPNDIYAVGLMLYWSKLARDGTSRGFILHYDGSTWREILRTDSGYQYHFLELTGSQNNVYVTEYQENTENRDSSLVTLYELSGNRLIKLYSNTLGDGLVSVAVIDDKLYLCVGVHNAKVYLHSGGKFIEQFSVNDLGFLVGRNEKDIFLAMSDGVAHFNGADIRYLYRFPRKYLVSNSAVFEREVFFCIYDGATGTNMILHGRLRQ
ncbi:MAG: hypothetical protein ACPL7O_08205, partial [Armatimonadota bacterium]